ncbi:hypothetical protein CVT25_010660 [Psilocybe cyanescens]|uniref:Uncharacterized protein n=1 Tax=Psilocybe cyanescens TaxID=93625 RepID=A0A409WJT1_PSICY|nr:hypothetical protein CVT25_010660 [Psilocybe cyanescens]
MRISHTDAQVGLQHPMIIAEKFAASVKPALSKIGTFAKDETVLAYTWLLCGLIRKSGEKEETHTHLTNTTKGGQDKETHADRIGTSKWFEPAAYQTKPRSLNLMT